MTRQKYSGIYLLTNQVNGKIYIGKSTDIKNRMSKHKHSKKSKDRHFPISQAIDKYGWENFKLSILESLDDYPNAYILEREAYWIEYYDSTNKEKGYNILKYSSDWTGFKHSEESKKKMSASKKGTQAGEKNPMFGRRHTQEAKDSISKLNTGRIPVNRRKIRQLSKETGELIKEWDSVKEASDTLGLSLTHVAAAARAKPKFHHTNKKYYTYNTAGGFKWEYV